ncbi:MAG TPA: M3 family metallopeptidase [Candidatus Limnocylindria bacterium]|nr:M3 family metallopeptidase [Candidatus Limnocylindria bacterium]
MLYDYTTVTPESVASDTDAGIASADALVDAAAASADAPTFDDTLRRLELAGAAVADAYGPGAFMAQVHPDAAVRDAGQEAEERINKWRVALAFRDDVYRAVRAYAATDDAKQLSGERARLLEHWLRDFRRAGHELEPEQRAELERLRNRLVEIEIAFQRNVNEYEDWIEVSREQLAGLPEDFVERLKPGQAPGTYRVSLDYPEVNPFLEQARDRSLREVLSRKSWNKAVEANRALLTEALELRQRIADLLGHPTWAHHAMEVKMAGNPDRVRAFYDELVPPLKAAAEREMAEMRRLLEADGEQRGIEAWDWLYYDTRQSREEYGVDQNQVSEYLPLDGVLDGMFAITGDVFGLDYRRVEDAKAWHPSVQLYEIRDRDSGELLAHFYTDLFPREGKYGHAAAFPLIMGHRRADGSYAKPVTAIVANFTPPAGDRPSLLRHGQHGEVETLFHEFGHILHMSLTKAEFVRFSGAETEWDFVEAPSQIMEHWVWQPEVMQRFARHYRSGEPLPDELARKMADSRYLNVGIRATRQVWLGSMDLALHTSTTVPDMDRVMRDAFAVTGIAYPEDTFYLSGFAHLVGGYDAGYYGYLWAEVIGDDMFGRFASEGILSADVGRAYRRAVLEPNGSRSADEMLLEFLGRPPSNDTYLRMRGMTTEGSAG